MNAAEFTSDRERQRDQIIAAYLDGREAGPPPAPDEWLRRYPEFARELLALFRDHQQLDLAAR
jgi:DNA invertase Pin-like site-specific DNA recombinase